MADAHEVRAVCASLDPSNDGHWTSQGVPRMDVLQGMGLPGIDRRTLNELLPGFTRDSLLEERTKQGAPVELAPVEPAPEKDPYFRHMLERAERRKAAWAWLAQGGFTAADLADPTSPLQRRVSAQNQRERRGIA
jgi:hypothetical protein